VKSTVLFTPSFSSGGPDAVNLRVEAMLDELGFTGSLSAGDRVAVKVHPGELNNTAYLRPGRVSSVVGHLADAGAHPFVTESTTLYCRERFNPEELLRTAALNGFTERSLGCRFVVADTGPDLEVETGGRHLPAVGVASEVAGADALLVMSHFTGHAWTAGIGGAVKHLGMGCVGRRSKAEAHLSTDISIDREACTACGTCVDTCKSAGVVVEGDAAVLTRGCVRCGVCIGSCPAGAIGYAHDYERFAEALAEAALGVTRCFEPGRVAFLNFLVDLTWHCDCEDFSDDPVFPDTGVLASFDPVAIDQASADLVNRREPVPGTRADTAAVRESADRLLALSGIKWWRQLDFGEEKGLGSRSYTLSGQT